MFKTVMEIRPDAMNAYTALTLPDATYNLGIKKEGKMILGYSFFGQSLLYGYYFLLSVDYSSYRLAV